MITEQDYKFGTKPFKHQLKAFKLSRDEEYFALLMEQGTGKTKIIIDTAAWLFGTGQIDTLIVLAPNGVHRNWITDEIPIHMPEYVDWVGHTWRAGDLKKKKTKAKLTDMLRAALGEGLQILAMNIESVITIDGEKVINAFLKGRRVLMVIDESTDIKTPGIKRTQKIIGRGKARGFSALAKYRRILDGTPITQGPFDLYAPYNFLDPEIIGFDSFHVFKHHFGVFEKHMNWSAGKEYETLVEYQNMDELQKCIAPYTFAITKDECLDLPPKIYKKRYFQLNKDQRKVYDQLRDEFIIEFESGDRITAALAIVRLMRLQQVASNYIGTEDGERKISDSNPRMKALVEAVRNSKKIIVWCRFIHDVDDAIAGLTEAGYRCVRYDGQTKVADRAEAIAKFQGYLPDKTPVMEHEQADVMVANPDAAGRGLTLHAADHCVYYSNSFKAGSRMQSEDRAHRAGLTHSVTYTDLIAEDTIDEHIVEVLRAKKALANEVVGENFRRMLK
jgi:SNF2 family DNA or RNA helicase